MTAPFPISIRRGCLRRKFLEQRREYLLCLTHLRDRLGFREVARRSPIRSAKVSGAMIVGVPRETAAGEKRVALVPDLIGTLTKAGLETHVQAGAGVEAGFPDAVYQDKGAQIKPSVLADADILLKVQPPTLDEIAQLKEGACLIGFLQPYTQQEAIKALAARKVTVLSSLIVNCEGVASVAEALVTTQAPRPKVPTRRVSAER